MSKATALVPAERIVGSILVVRGQRVIVDADLARLYGVTTKRLNEQVKRNKERFPPDFMFQLRSDEKEYVVANCDHLAKLKFSPTLPFAFTEHGAIMAASILNTQLAIEVSVYVVRAFIKLREALTSHKDLALKIGQLERRYDHNFKVVFDAVRQLMEPPATPARRIGFIANRKG